MDRTCRGLTAGLAGGVAMNAWNLFDYYFLHITRIRFLDWAAVLLTWHRPQSFIEGTVALVVQNVWNAFMGAVFAHLIAAITSRALALKSVVYSLIAWFTYKGVVNIARVPVLSDHQTFSGRMSNLLAVIVWGLVVALALERLERSETAGQVGKKGHHGR